MKFHVAILCVFLICTGSDGVNDGMENEIKPYFRDEIDEISGASKRFVDDVTFILKKMENNTLIESAFAVGLLKVLSSKGNAKLTSDDVRDFQFRLYEGRAAQEDQAEHIDYMKTLQSVLAANVPANRSDGIMNLCYIFFYPKARPEEIESALGYLYEETAEVNTALINLLADPTTDDCPVNFHRYSDAIDKLRSMIDLKPKVIEDAASFRDHFPCNDGALEFLEHFVYLITQFQGDQAKITACTMEKSLKTLKQDWESMKYVKRETDINCERMGYVLPTRLSAATFNGIMNFIKATQDDTSVDELQKALEYLYDDVATATCA